MRTLSTLLCAAALLAGCRSTKPDAQIADLCGLTKLPHATASEQAALRQAANDRFSRLKPFASTKANKAVAKAALEVSESGFGMPTGLPSPLATLLAPSGQPFGLPSFDRALTDLKRACS